MVMLKNPDNPATSKQLWLLHILTKTDTRGLKLTMAEASAKIEALKSGKPANKTQTPSGKTMLGPIEIVHAIKEITEHNWDGKIGFCIHTQIAGILPRGHKAHNLTWYSRDGITYFDSLFGHLRGYTEVPESEVKAFILSLPVKFISFAPIPEDVKPIAEAKACLLDSEIALYHLINGEYVRDGE